MRPTTETPDGSKDGRLTYDDYHSFLRGTRRHLFLTANGFVGIKSESKMFLGLISDRMEASFIMCQENDGFRSSLIQSYHRRYTLWHGLVWYHTAHNNRHKSARRLDLLM